MTDQTELIDQVVSGELDLTFVNTVEDPRLITEFLFADPIMFVTAADPAVPTGPIAASELNGRPLIGEQESSCQLLIESSLRLVGVSPTYVFRSNDNGAMQAMVRAGMGIAYMPALCVDPWEHGISVHATEPRLQPRQISIAWRSGRTQSPIAERFVDITVAVCAELVEKRKDVPAVA